MRVAGTRGQTSSCQFSLAPADQRTPPTPSPSEEWLGQAYDLLGGRFTLETDVRGGPLWSVRGMSGPVLIETQIFAR